jgi:hypothetical protein
VFHGQCGQLRVSCEVASRDYIMKKLERDLEMTRAGMEELDVRLGEPAGNVPGGLFDRQRRYQPPGDSWRYAKSQTRMARSARPRWCCSG